MQNPSKPAITVFGGTGFIGRNFAAYASAQGSAVAICGRSPIPAPLAPLATCHAFDATDLAATRSVVEQTRPEAIVFGISRTHPRGAPNADPSMALTELRALENVLEAAREFGAKQLVFFSSGGAVYGD